MRRLALVFYASCAVIAAEEPVSLRLSAPFVTPGGEIRVTCKVPRNEHNRKLSLGVENEQTSDRQLDGEAATITHEMWVKHLTCDAGSAFCELTLDSGKTRRVVQKVKMLGCPGDDSSFDSP
jgi:hypothetical protein